MAEVNISINGRQYGIACDDGQEQRVKDLAGYVDARLKEISTAGGATNESHLLVLTSLVMADEMFDLKDAAANGNRVPLNGLQITKEDESDIVNAIDHMAQRIDAIAGNLQKI
jgi:cell division protein ZapA